MRNKSSGLWLESRRPPPLIDVDGNIKLLRVTTAQAPEDQQQCVVLVDYRGARLLFDQVHQCCARRGLERARLPKVLEFV